MIELNSERTTCLPDIFRVAALAEKFFFMTVLLQGLTDDLKREPDTLEDLKFVLRVIADIRDKSLDVELRYVDIQERYRTILMYDIEVRNKIIISQSQPNCPCLKLHCMIRVANKFERRRQLVKNSRPAMLSLTPCRCLRRTTKIALTSK